MRHDLQHGHDQPSVPGVSSPRGLPGRNLPGATRHRNAAKRAAQDNHSPRHEHASSESAPLTDVARSFLRAFDHGGPFAHSVSRITVGAQVVYER